MSHQLSYASSEEPHLISGSFPWPVSTIWTHSSKYHHLKISVVIFDWNVYFRLSLVAHWKRIRLPMQETWVWSLTGEDSTCHGRTKPMCYNYWACAVEPGNCRYWVPAAQLLNPSALEPVLCKQATAMRSLHPTLREEPTQQQRSSTAINK